jgi:hypothetical protein
VGVLQLPLVGLFLAANLALWRRRELSGLRVLLAGMVFLYFAAHLPIYAIGRFSMVLVPLMVVYATGFVLDCIPRHSSSSAITAATAPASARLPVSAEVRDERAASTRASGTPRAHRFSRPGAAATT